MSQDDSPYCKPNYHKKPKHLGPKSPAAPEILNEDIQDIQEYLDSVEKIISEQPIPRGAINGHQINKFIMEELIRILRDADLVGILSKKIIAVLLPMTDNHSAKIAMSRLLRCLNAKNFVIRSPSIA